jgi:hypothetical protein
MNGAQTEFLSLLEKKDWSQALVAWNQAFSGQNFAQTTNGQALQDYLLFKNGLTLMATENVLSLNAKDIHPELLKEWKSELQSSPIVQKMWVKADNSWKKIVGPGEIPLSLKKNSEIVKAFKYADALPKEMLREKATVWWQIATRAPQIEQTNFALQALKNLKNSKQTTIGQDQISLATARVLYQRGDIDGALKAYYEVPKSSDLWLQAIEERAWSYLRKNDYDRALGEITTILAPTFEKLIGPEPYFLSNLLSLKVCDYNRIFKVGDQFKSKNRVRLSELQTLATQGTNTALPVVFERIDSKGVTLQALGPQAEFMPRAILKDREFIKAMNYRFALLNEVKTAQKLLGDSASLGSNQELEKMIADSRAHADQARARGLARARQLAQSQIAEFKQILKKMHIVEAEVIERLELDPNLKGERSKLSKVKDSGDVLVFQYTDEVWLDELDNYRARVKDCPTLKGASL